MNPLNQDVDLTEPVTTGPVTRDLSSTEILARVLVIGGGAFLVAAATLIGKGISDLLVTHPTISGKDPREQLIQLLIAYAVPLMELFWGLVMALFGFGLLRAARTATRDVIPDKDFPILQKLIEGEKEKGIDLYVRLSSLIGVSGVFTRLELLGLPLATIGLTLVFTFVSFWGGKDYLDLARLTLGAFIGSYVQRQVTTAAPSGSSAQSAQTGGDGAKKKLIPL